MNRLRRMVKRHSRLPGAFFGVFAVCYGVLQIMRGQLSYQNYWGGLVFAPFAIVLGVLVLYISLFRHDRVAGAWRDRKGRPVRFPADGFRKW
jgi:hypothetical protein